MGRKGSLANQECPEFLVPLVFVVTWEIQAIKVKRDSLLLDPQAYPGHPDWMVRKESQEILHLVTQGPLETEVFQEYQE